MIKIFIDSFDDKRIRFLFVGGLNTVVGYGCYALLLKVGMFYIFANLIANIVGIANSYFWNKYFTFKVKKKSFNEIIRFLTVYGISYIANLIFLFVCVETLSMNKYLAGIGCLFVTTIVSYIGHNKFSFKS